MKRLIRIDDYPHGNPGYDRKVSKARLGVIFGILNKYDVPFIIGVIPKSLIVSDYKFFSDNLGNGKAVMHGFTHGFQVKPWMPTIREMQTRGGEFADMSMTAITNAYAVAHRKMLKIDNYDKEYFIPPFGCYTQELLDVLNKKKVKYLHICDLEYNKYGYKKLNYGNLKVIISKFHVTYDHIHKVIKNLNSNSQITLHWTCDCKRENWKNNYVTLCKAL